MLSAKKSHPRTQDTPAASCTTGGGPRQTSPLTSPSGQEIDDNRRCGARRRCASESVRKPDGISFETVVGSVSSLLKYCAKRNDTSLPSTKRALLDKTVQTHDQSLHLAKGPMPTARKVKCQEEGTASVSKIEPEISFVPQRDCDRMFKSLESYDLATIAVHDAHQARVCAGKSHRMYRLSQDSKPIALSPPIFPKVCCDLSPGDACSSSSVNCSTTHNVAAHGSGTSA